MDPLIIIILSIIGVLIIAGILIVYFVSKAFQLHLIQIDQCESDLDVALTKRLDALEHVVLEIKKEVKPDPEFLNMLQSIRQQGHQSTIIEKQVFGQQILEMLNALFENITLDPVLTQKNRKEKLFETLLEAETDLERAKLAYNELVTSYNKKVVTFPTNIIAKHKKCVKRELFESDTFHLK